MASFKRIVKSVALVAALSRVALADGAITVSGTNFTLTGDNVSYLFHVDPSTGDLTSDHFGGPSDGFLPPATLFQGGWIDGLSNTRREFPDVGRSDFRVPAIHIKHASGSTVTAFRYQSHEIIQGKPALSGLPATYGNASDVTTLIVRLYDNYTDIGAALSYSIFPKYNAVARSFQLTNNGTSPFSVERAASISLDMPNVDLKMLEMQGDWAHEMNRVVRNVDYGETTFRSTMGYSSHVHNPFFALMEPTTTETTGQAWGFNLVYSGSFAATAERFSNGFVRVLLGLNPLEASIPVQPNGTFNSPEAVAVYSSAGRGGMSRSFHDLYRNHLMRSNYTHQTRPVLLNSWEGLGFDYNETSMVKLAGEAAQLGAKLFVNDDGWFGVEYPRDNDTMGLGDWTPNPAKFPDGLHPYVEQVNNITTLNSTDKMEFGIWMEPEMVNENSTLYHEHPDWALHSGDYPRTVTRHQLVLNLALPEVQDFVITSVSNVLDSANVRYIKWDDNRGIHETPSPATDYAYMLGLYNIVNNLTTRYPSVLWEGCASGGGRFDPGLLHYWPQTWTSDNTDAADRLIIQMGTSIAYPPSAMACHVSAIPNGITQRNISVTYRAHVAMMCGSFGFELNPPELTPDELQHIPDLLQQQARIQPIVISGSFYRLALPDNTNWPAVQFVSSDGSEAVALAFQQLATVKPSAPPLRFQGLNPSARYRNDLDNGTYSGATYMNAGMQLPWQTADYQSMVIWLEKQ